ncbi:MAG: hypothetical protein RRB13_09760 [bacterium]|nr:hypothetical protein [bacterium]
MIKSLYQQLSEPSRRPLEKVCQLYAQAGFQCWLVGGSLRDLLIGEIPGDFDLATNAPLEATRRIFHKVFETGPDHGTLTIRLLEQTFEVTRFRRDVATDGRHAQISFAETIEEDLSRRDLRINAIAFDPLTGEFRDPEGGLVDLQEKIIRFVGPAGQRVREDHLRALRYLRMLARLMPQGFSYDPAELAEVQATFLPEVLSLERVYEELGKMRRYASKANHFLAEQLTALQPFKAHLSPQGHQDLIPKLLVLPDQTALGWAVAFERGESKAPEDLRLSKKEKRRVKALLSFPELLPEQTPKLRAFISQVPAEDRPDLAQAAQVLFEQPLLAPIQAILAAGDPLEIKDLALDAAALMEMGLQGKALGAAQRRLLEALFEAPEHNQPDQLRQLLSQNP